MTAAQGSPPLWSIVFMCYNESGTLEDGVRRARATARAQGWSFEIVIVDDGSTDGSADIAKRLASQFPEVRVIAHERNSGIGSVLKDGYFKSKGDIVVIIPGDLQFAPEDLAPAAAAMDGADVVNICRQLRHDPWPRRMMSAVERTVTWLLFGLSVGDLHWVKIYRRNVLAKVSLESVSSLVDTELLVKARRGGASIKSVTLPHYPRVAGQSHSASLRWLRRSLVDLIKLRFAL